MFGFGKKVVIDDSVHVIPNFLVLFQSGLSEIGLTGEIEISWAESEIAYEMPIQCNFKKWLDRETYIVELNYEIDTGNFPKELTGFLSNHFRRKVFYSHSGKLLRDELPVLLPSASNLDSQLAYDSNAAEEESDKSEGIATAKINSTIENERGVLATPIRDHVREVVRSVSLSRDIADEDKLVFDLSTNVDVKTLKFGPFRGRQLISDEIVVSKSTGRIVSLAMRLPSGPWWILDLHCRLRFPQE